jgi:hypothetical protein
LPLFPHRDIQAIEQNRGIVPGTTAELLPWRGFSAIVLQNLCTNSGHPLVDELHPINFKADKTVSFYLTLKFKGVETTSFFDNF